MTPWLIAAPALAIGFASFAAYGAVHSQSHVFGPTLRTTSRREHLALTFDDGPNPAITPKLLDLLDRYHANATFFVVGKFVREHPALVKEIAARGHLLGNHTDSHPNLFFSSPSETRNELLRCTEAVQHAAWLEPRWFRPPFGYRSPWLGDLVHQQNMRTVMWSLLPGDWRPKSVDWLIHRMQPIADHASQQRGASAPQRGHPSGDILCLHDGDYTRPNGDRTRTLAALEFWLPLWRDAGLEFVTISEAARKAVEA